MAWRTPSDQVVTQFTASEMQLQFTVIHCIRCNSKYYFHLVTIWCISKHQMLLHLTILLPSCHHSLRREDFGVQQFPFCHNLRRLLMQRAPQFDLIFVTIHFAGCTICTAPVFFCNFTISGLNSSSPWFHFIFFLRCNPTLACSSNSLRCNSLDWKAWLAIAYWLHSNFLDCMQLQLLL